MPTYHPNSEVVSTQLNDDESFLLSLKTQQYYSLNETGSRIWELLSDGHTIPDIAEALTEEWDVSHDEAVTYVKTFLQELNDEGLVKAVDDSAE